jgi:hypothetical protein
MRSLTPIQNRVLAGLALLLCLAGSGEAPAQEMSNLKLNIISTYTTPVGPGAGSQHPERPEGGMQQTVQSKPEKAQPSGGAFRFGLRSSPAQCAAWPSAGLSEQWIGPDPLLTRACLFQFEFPKF